VFLLQHQQQISHRHHHHHHHPPPENNQKKRKIDLFPKLWIPYIQEVEEDEGDSAEEDFKRRQKVVDRIHGIGGKPKPNTTKVEKMVKCMVCLKDICSLSDVVEIPEYQRVGKEIFEMKGVFGKAFVDKTKKLVNCRDGHTIGVVVGSKRCLSADSKVTVVLSGEVNDAIPWSEELWKDDFKMVDGCKDVKQDDIWMDPALDYDELYCEICKEKRHSMKSFRDHLQSAGHRTEVKFYLLGL